MIITIWHSFILMYDSFTWVKLTKLVYVWHMSDSMVLGTFPCTLKIQCTIFHLMHGSSSNLMLPSLLGALDFNIFLEPFLSFISLLAKLKIGLNGSVYLRWLEASLTFLFNLTWIFPLHYHTPKLMANHTVKRVVKEPCV